MSRTRRALSEAEPTPSEMMLSVEALFSDLYGEPADDALARLAKAAAASVYGTTSGTSEGQERMADGVGSPATKAGTDVLK